MALPVLPKKKHLSPADRDALDRAADWTTGSSWAAIATPPFTHTPKVSRSSTPKPIPKKTVFPDRGPKPSKEEMVKGMKACLDVQRQGVAQGKRPFAATLVGPDPNAPALLSHFSISHVEHAESSLALLASKHYTQEYLWLCTLYTTWEPCAMCTGTIYWANIGRIVFGATEEKLGELTGKGNEENFTMSMRCQAVISKGQKPIEVMGPIGSFSRELMSGCQIMEREIIEVCEEWWRKHQTTAWKKS